MLKVNKVNGYYKELQALWDVSLTVNEGELVALIGPNGAGKTTTLRVLSGLHKAESGSIEFMGRNIANEHPHRIVELGISQVPETGKIFTAMSVLENLELGAYIPSARDDREKSLKWVFEIFPRLEERKKQQAGTLSGGERQMLSIGRALMARPKLLMLDEPSFGLAPILVEHMFEMIKKINQQVEQNVQIALEMSHRAYLLENGRIVQEGNAKDLLTFEAVRSSYLG